MFSRDFYLQGSFLLYLSHVQLPRVYSTYSHTLISANTAVAAVATGGRHTCVVVMGGSLRCWGSNDRFQLAISSTGDQRSPVAAGSGLFLPYF